MVELGSSVKMTRRRDTAVCPCLRAQSAWESGGARRRADFSAAGTARPYTAIGRVVRFHPKSVSEGPCTEPEWLPFHRSNTIGKFNAPLCNLVPRAPGDRHALLRRARRGGSLLVTQSSDPRVYCSGARRVPLKRGLHAAQARPVGGTRHRPRPPHFSQNDGISSPLKTCRSTPLASMHASRITPPEDPSRAIASASAAGAATGSRPISPLPTGGAGVPRRKRTCGPGSGDGATTPSPRPDARGRTHCSW